MDGVRTFRVRDIASKNVSVALSGYVDDGRLFITLGEENLVTVSLEDGVLMATVFEVKGKTYHSLKDLYPHMRKE